MSRKYHSEPSGHWDIMPTAQALSLNPQSQHDRPLVCRSFVLVSLKVLDSGGECGQFITVYQNKGSYCCLMETHSGEKNLTVGEVM